MKTLKNYKKLFADFWGYHENDIPICWSCYKAQAVDIHHLTPKGMGGVKKNRLNRIDNFSGFKPYLIKEYKWYGRPNLFRYDFLCYFTNWSEYSFK